ncbi:MAG: tetratricopeptide repeat protein [Kofleriaceae bacterium]
MRLALASRPWCYSLRRTRRDAQTPTAKAEALFEQGKALMASGRVPEACTAFESSQRIDPAVTTLLNIADCREKNGQLATAWGVFVDVERQTRGSANLAPLHDVAVKRSAALEPRLSKLTIAVASQLDRIEITRNDAPVERDTWSFALPIDGGRYQIVAQVPGFVAWRSTVDVAREGATVVVHVPELVAVAPPPPRSKMPAILTGIGALVLGGAALGFERSARSVYSDAEAEADNERQTSRWDSANRQRHIAQGFGIAALATSGVAVILYLRSTRTPPAHTAMVPVLARELTGVAWTGAW